LLEDGLERERGKSVSVSLVKFRLEFDPVETQGVEKGRQTFHQAQDAHGQDGPERKDGPKKDPAVPKNTKPVDSAKQTGHGIDFYH